MGRLSPSFRSAPISFCTATPLAAPPAAAARRYTVSVRALCDFTARVGSLDLRFTPAPSAQEGIDGHRSVAARRGDGWQAELPLAGEFGRLRVRGRADLVDTARQHLHEVKTYKGELERMPAHHRALHWAQAKVYGWLLCREHALPSLSVSLVYLDIASRRETLLTLRVDAAELRRFFEALCERFVDWADRELAHRARRDGALAALRFPHPDLRAGQRPLAESVFRAARRGRCLLAQAPTGIGKTVGTLFPLLKACPGEAIDKLFFLTAKNSGRAAALHAVAALDPAGASGPRALRVIERVARDKACEHPDKACHGDSCPLAHGFYDRLGAARSEAVAGNALLTHEHLREVARRHAVCPYYLGQELVKWCDLVVADYNHFFDGHAQLHALTAAHGWRVAVLVDEAHNLVERAREMYSATLSSAALQAARAVAPPALGPAVQRVQRACRALVGAQTEPYRALAEVPAAWTTALTDLAAAVGEHLAEQPGGGIGGGAAPLAPDFQRLHFDVLHFLRLAESFGAHSLFDISVDAGTAAGAGEARLCIRNVVPAPFLAPRFAATRTTVLFSATLTPEPFYADALGLPADTAWLDVAAPFDAAQLAVRVVRGVSTRFARRGESLAPIAALIAGQYHARPGNYLAFFSSFDYLARAADAFAAAHPEVPLWRQSRRMDDDARAAFLARFRDGGRGVGFAVLGGAFAEGVDLPGERLIGAFIATLGLPQVNPVNEAMRRRLDGTFDGAGFEYTYLFPGLRKVVQAAGRVIRTPSDRGSLHLIDDRFARPEVLRLLPAWWRVEVDAPGDGGR